jgi:putative endopeptidase
MRAVMRRAISCAMVLLACGGKTTIEPTPPVERGSATARVAPMPEPPPPPAKMITTTSLAAIGLDPDALDRQADPCEDFYQFACGGWMARTEIPADKSMAMRSFVDIDDRNRDFLHATLEKLRKDPGTDPVNRQVAAFYGGCMDEAAIAKVGLAPLAPLRATIDKVKDVKSLSAALAQLFAQGLGMLFALGPTIDSADARSMILELHQGGLGLPEREYYTNSDDASNKLRGVYEVHIATMLSKVGRRATAKADAAAVLALETELAKLHKDKVAIRDPKGTYNKIDKAGVAKLMPSFDWAGMWNALGLAKIDGVTVTAPAYFAGLDKLLASTRPEVWRAYLTYHLVSRLAHVSKELEDQQFELEKALSGQPQQEARWKRCVAATDHALGDLVGQVFVRERFAGASKKAAEDQIHAIVAAMQRNLATLPWMDAETKKKANEKLAAMEYLIGYPKKWRTYDIKIDPKRWAASSLAATKLNYHWALAQAGKPVERDLWQMSASTVNAYYDAQRNHMVYPAGILQPPFYSVDASIAVNLGAMGMVVGHELTHGFDDRGSQYDAVGNLTNWWQPQTEKQFKERTQCVIDQYSRYDAGGGKVNGKLTVGENIADAGGIKLAFAAYRALRATAPDAIVADGFTEDQAFFLAFGQAWCAKMRPEIEKLLVNTDSHAPPRWRINGTLSSTPDFAKAFRCAPGAKLAPTKPCEVW